MSVACQNGIYIYINVKRDDEFFTKKFLSGWMRVRACVHVSMRKLFHQCLVCVCVSVICGNIFQAPQTSEKRSNQILFIFASFRANNHNKLIQMQIRIILFVCFMFHHSFLCATSKWNKTKQKMCLLSIPRWSTFYANIKSAFDKFI